MDIFISKFVNSVIHDLDLEQLDELNQLINLSDENLIKISNDEIKHKEKNNSLFKKFKKTY